MQPTTLSVAIPNFNHSKYLPQTLEAVLSQSRPPDEVIVVDDCSTDNSLEIIEWYAARSPLIRVIRHETNQGAIEALNRASGEARGEYLYTLASDDLPLPGLFERALQMLSANPSAGLFCAFPANLIDDTGAIEPMPVTWSTRPHFFPPGELAKVLDGGYIAGTSAIVRRSAFESVGRFLPQLRWHSDWFFSLVLAFRHGLCFSPEVLGAYRVRKDAYSRAGTRRADEQKKVIQELIRALKSPQFRDVLPCFVQGGAFCHFGAEAASALLESPDLWDVESFLLVQQQLIELTTQKKKVDAQALFETHIKFQNAVYEGLATARRLRRGGQTKEALKVLQSTMSQYPTFLEPYREAAEVLIEVKQHQDALAVIEIALRVNPLDPESFLLRSRAYEALQRHSEAQEASLRAQLLGGESLPVIETRH